MIQFEELRLQLLEDEDALKELSSALGLEEMRKEVATLEEQTAADGFWEDLGNSQKVLQRVSMLKNRISAYETLKSNFDDALVMIELANEEGDLDLLPECQESVKAVKRRSKPKRWQPFSAANLIPKTPSLPSMRVQGARRRRIGQRCCSACIIIGASAMALR